jgi:hypothetical protein
MESQGVIKCILYLACYMKCDEIHHKQFYLNSGETLYDVMNRTS